MNNKLSPISIFSQSGGQIEEKLKFHAVQDDTYSRENEAQSYVIEDGSEISDHITNKPLNISLTGIISNFPIISNNEVYLPEDDGFLLDLLKDKFSWVYQSEDTKLNKEYFRESENKVQESKDILNEIMEKKLLVSIVSENESFMNMSLESFSYKGRKDVIVANLSFKEIRIQNLKTESVSKEFIDELIQHTAAPKKQKGRTDKTEASSKQKNQLSIDKQQNENEKQEKGRRAISLSDPDTLAYQIGRALQ